MTVSPNDPYRSDLPKCPVCGLPAASYDVMWDYLTCPEGHAWDGPLNDPALRGCTLPSGSSPKREG